MAQHIVALIDAPDPDNFVMLIALYRLFPESTIHIGLTGRPVRFGADKSHALWDWDAKSSRMAQEASAARIKNLMRHFCIRVTHVYDAGIAPYTLVPHWVHFAEYYRFNDVDPLRALRYSELEPQEDLIRIMLEHKCMVVVGGPMTGLYQMSCRTRGAIMENITEIHAMFATWGNVELMRFDDKPRGALQFNVACDPQAAHHVLMGRRTPTFLMPTEVTRVQEIGFANAQAVREFLPNTDGGNALYMLYALWYDAAVRPRQERNPSELIFMHDVASALSACADVRNAIYVGTPVRIESVPHETHEAHEWGKVCMTPRKRSHVWAATAFTDGGHDEYLRVLKSLLA